MEVTVTTHGRGLPNGATDPEAPCFAFSGEARSVMQTFASYLHGLTVQVTTGTESFDAKFVSPATTDDGLEAFEVRRIVDEREADDTEVLPYFDVRRIYVY